MAVAEEIEPPPPLPSSSGRMARLRERLGLYGLFGVLAAFTLFTMDGADLAPRMISAVFLVLAAGYLSVPFTQTLPLSVPTVCLLLMTLWGVLQTLFSPQKIVANGWVGVLFWFTAAIISLVATQLFRSLRTAAVFRRWFMFFAAGVCLLELLEQASHTSLYYWMIPSKYHAVFGPFAYWNNFAQFVELALPITLWTGLSKRHSSPVPYLFLAALQVGAVVASGSRAGTALVLAELLAVVALAYRKRHDRRFLVGAALAFGLSFLTIYAAGSNVLIKKLQEHDQLAVRRSIDRSSLEMIRERPLLGWGLKTYVPVYRMFAHYDDGTYVNQAHNDWFEWAAEGGIPFACFMLVVFVWSIRPAVHSIWGLGLIAICIHAIVDYPFARLGVCGWYFALVPMFAAEIAERRNIAETSPVSRTSLKQKEPEA
jgi:O-antigen ligase